MGRLVHFNLTVHVAASLRAAQQLKIKFRLTFIRVDKAEKNVSFLKGHESD